ncbi:hypothetical protein Sjap_010677 [Stephania japonica]|uniref:non-specific serine/threonine protein kinase n=1 Tax=Stephania japonica TaxID=461633 RepID=A0AAP0JAX1_9MAGN
MASALNLSFYFMFFVVICPSSVSTLTSDGETLLQLAGRLSLPQSIKSSWNPNDPTPCNWIGVQCDNNTTSSHVISFNLSGSAASGTLGPEIGRLKHLRSFYLTDNSLSGAIPDTLGNCAYLEEFDLSNNNFSGGIPETLGDLMYLTAIGAFGNSLTGEIPESLFRIPVLEVVYLSDNHLNGSIPASVGNATNLTSLYLYGNHLSGRIPNSIGDCRSLREIHLSDNLLVGGLPDGLSELKDLVSLDVSFNGLEGRIPVGLGSLKYLELLDLSTNRFSGAIPSSLGNCSALTTLSVVHNSLTGQIPSSIGLLTELEHLYLAENLLSGNIPSAIGNCRSLKELTLQYNRLEGEIPKELGSLRNMTTLQMFNNHLTGEIPLGVWRIPNIEIILVYDNNLSGELPVEMTELRNLREVTLFNNHFTGVIPQALGINSSLQIVDFTNNQFTGKIPPDICFGKQLQILTLGENQLEGGIPPDVGNCSTLQRLNLNQNKLTGSLPKFTKNSNLSHLDISENDINGTIPSTLSNCINVSSINLSRNRLTGPIPREVGNLVQLQFLNLSCNKLQGPLPLEIAGCTKLYKLDVGFNLLNGSLPSALTSLKQLSTLILWNNRFDGGIPTFLADLDGLMELQLGSNMLGGSIPPSLGELQSLEYALNLSDNGLIGSIPSELGKLSMLQNLDLSHNHLSGALATIGEMHSLLGANFSYNNFTGPIPDTLIKFLTTSPSSFLGNPGLCILYDSGTSKNFGDSLRIGSCDHQSSREKSLGAVEISMIVVGSILFCLLVLVLLVCILIKSRGSQKKFDEFANDDSSVLLNQVLQATENLNDRYIVGRGSHGVVYKASLGLDKLYAVKKLVFASRKGASASMVREIETIGQIRHRNLVRLEHFWLRKDRGLILYNYMENGSLHDVLHETNPPLLKWEVRYRIALGTAQGMAYLHNDCNPTIVHRDIKPKNILLDSEMEPHISDFGIAKLMDQPSASTNSISIMGTIGYMAPEAAFTTMKSKESDVYSYGVVLLELITRKQALDHTFPDDMDIVGWVRSSWHDMEDIAAVVDPELVEEFIDSSTMEEVIDVLSLALHCTSKEPSKRPSMRDVVKLLTDAKSQQGRVAQSCISMALSDFYSFHSNYNSVVVPHFRNSEGGVLNAASAALDLINNVGVQAIIGPETSEEADLLAQIGSRAHIPIISFSAISSLLSPTQFPYLVRVAQNVSSQVRAIAAVVAAYGWKEVSIIHDESQSGTAILPYLTDALQEIGTVLRSRTSLSSIANTTRMDDMLTKLNGTSTRVFIVHLPFSLSAEFFLSIKKAGMMKTGYAWILTCGITDLLGYMDNSMLYAMEGVIGVKTHIPSSDTLKSFRVRWMREFRQEKFKVRELSIYSLWAYDTTSMVAKIANEVARSSSSELVPNSKLDSKGLSGEIQLVNEQLQSSNFEIINVRKRRVQRLGYWTPRSGLSQLLDDEDKLSTNERDLGTVIWPGGSKSIPRSKLLKVGVPVKAGFFEFLNVSRVANDTSPSVNGYSKDVFVEVMRGVPYEYKYIPFENDHGAAAGDYNDLTYQVHNKMFDVVVGDVTILANRSNYVDFTQPYSESGFRMIVPIKDDDFTESSWWFLKPLTLELWLITIAFFFMKSILVWLFEHEINSDFQGTFSQQVGKLFSFSFSTLVFAHRENLESNYSRFIVNLWTFALYILVTCYAANLTSMLAVDNLRPAVKDLDALLREGKSVGYQKESFILDFLRGYGFPESRLMALSSASDYADALSKGSDGGGVSAVVDEIPYIQVFPKGSPLLSEVSRAVLEFTEGNRIKTIQSRWFGSGDCPYPLATNGTSKKLKLYDFRSIYEIMAIASGAVLIIFILSSIFKLSKNGCLFYKSSHDNENTGEAASKAGTVESTNDAPNDATERSLILINQSSCRNKMLRGETTNLALASNYEHSQAIPLEVTASFRNDLVLRRQNQRRMSW